MILHFCSSRIKAEFTMLLHVIGKVKLNHFMISLMNESGRVAKLYGVIDHGQYVDIMKL